MGLFYFGPFASSAPLVIAQQLHTASIVGAVLDPNDAVVPGAKVEVTSPDLIGVQSGVTDAQGNYRFILLPIGTYVLKVNAAGFAPVIRGGIQLSADQTLTIEINLELAGVAQAVEVNAAAPVVDVKSSTASTAFGQLMIIGVADFT